MKILLSEIIEVMQMPADDERSYVSLDTGELITVMEEELKEAATDKPIESFSDWDQGPMALAREVFENPEKYKKLPVAGKKAELKIMERFLQTIEDPVAKDALKDALEGANAFRAFKKIVNEFSLAKDWFGFRNQFYRSAASKWCEKNNIQYEAD